VSRAKENMAYKVKKTLTKGVKGILKDQLVVLKNAKHEGMLLRRVEVQVEMDGKERLMVFITNNLSVESTLGVRPLPEALGHRGVF
jgi:hypothetical protein